MMDFKQFLDESGGTKKDNPFMYATTMPQHPTGFMYLDYGCGSYVNVYNDDEEPIYTYHNVGIPSGSVNTVISKSQGGKTTLCFQMAVAIIEAYFSQLYQQKYIRENTPPKMKVEEQRALPFIQIIDTEKTFSMDYAKKLSHYTNKQLANRVMINQITTDTELVSLLEKHIKYKVEFMNPMVCPMLDIFGKPILEYPPTVIIVVSMTQLLMDNIDDPTKIDAKKGGLQDVYDSATKGPAGAQRAKVISALYSQLVNYAKKYNIIIFSINHINKTPSIMGIPTKMFRALRANESLSGGERAIYLSSSILRLDVIKSINSISSSAVNLGEDIKGHIAIASWIKCKSNSKSNTCQLAFTNINGYDQLLSNLWNGKEIGDLHKKGNFYFVDKHPDKLFTFKNYSDVFASNPELFSAYYDQLRGNCEKLLDNPDIAQKKNEELAKELRDDIHNDDNFSRGDKMDMDDIFSSLMND